MSRWSVGYFPSRCACSTLLLRQWDRPVTVPRREYTIWRSASGHSLPEPRLRKVTRSTGATGLSFEKKFGAVSNTTPYNSNLDVPVVTDLSATSTLPHRYLPVAHRVTAWSTSCAREPLPYAVRTPPVYHRPTIHLRARSWRQSDRPGSPANSP